MNTKHNLVRTRERVRSSHRCWANTARLAVAVLSREHYLESTLGVRDGYGRLVIVNAEVVAKPCRNHRIYLAED
jgi:hypothetical protein